MTDLSKLSEVEREKLFVAAKKELDAMEASGGITPVDSERIKGFIERLQLHYVTERPDVHRSPPAAPVDLGEFFKSMLKLNEPG